MWGGNGDCQCSVVAGLRAGAGDWVLSATGEPLQDDRHYRVLVNSFMYAGGDNFSALGEADPQGFDTGIHYRQPFVDWLAGLSTSSREPLTLERLRRAIATQP